MLEIAAAMRDGKKGSARWPFEHLRPIRQVSLHNTIDSPRASLRASRHPLDALPNLGFSLPAFSFGFYEFSY